MGAALKPLAIDAKTNLIQEKKEVEVPKKDANFYQALAPEQDLIQKGLQRTSNLYQDHNRVAAAVHALSIPFIAALDTATFLIIAPIKFVSELLALNPKEAFLGLGQDLASAGKCGLMTTLGVFYAAAGIFYPKIFLYMTPQAKELLDAQAKNKQLETQIVKLKASNEAKIAELEKQIDGIRSTRDMAISRANGNAADVRELQRMLHQLRHKNEEYEHTLQGLRAEIGRYESTINKSTRFSDYQTQIIARQEKFIAQLQRENEEWRGKSDELIDVNIALERRIYDLKDAPADDIENRNNKQALLTEILNKKEMLIQKLVNDSEDLRLELEKAACLVEKNQKKDQLIDKLKSLVIQYQTSIIPEQQTVIKALKEQIVQLQSTNGDLSTKLDTTKAKLANNLKKLTEISTQADEMLSNNARLAPVSVLNAKLKNAHQKYEAYAQEQTREFKAIVTDIQKKHAAILKQEKTTRAELEREHQSLQAKAEKILQDKETLVKTIPALRDDLVNLRATVVKLKNANGEEIGQLREKMVKALEAFRQREEIIQQELREKAQTNAELKEKLQTLTQSTIKTLKSTKAFQDTIDVERARLTSQIKELERQLERAGVNVEENRAKDASITNLQQEIIKLHKMIEERETFINNPEANINRLLASETRRLINEGGFVEKRYAGRTWQAAAQNYIAGSTISFPTS